MVKSASFSMPVASGLIKRVAAGKRGIAELFTAEQEEFLMRMARRHIDFKTLAVLGPVTAQRWRIEDPACPWPITAELWKREDGDLLMEVSIKAPIQQAAVAVGGFMAFLAEVGAERDKDEQAKTRWALAYYAAKLARSSSRRTAVGKKAIRKAATSKAAAGKRMRRQRTTRKAAAANSPRQPAHEVAGRTATVEGAAEGNPQAGFREVVTEVAEEDLATKLRVLGRARAQCVRIGQALRSGSERLPASALRQPLAVLARGVEADLRPALHRHLQVVLVGGEEHRVAVDVGGQ